MIDHPLTSIHLHIRMANLKGSFGLVFFTRNIKPSGSLYFQNKKMTPTNCRGHLQFNHIYQFTAIHAKILQKLSPMDISGYLG